MGPIRIHPNEKGRAREDCWRVGGWWRGSNELQGASSRVNLKYNPLLKIEFFLACKRGWYRDHGAESKNRRRKRKRKKKEKKEGCGAARAKVSSARSYGKHVIISSEADYWLKIRRKYTFFRGRR